MKELKKFLLMFGLALVVSFLGYKFFVPKCAYFEGDNQITQNCTCLGKKININYLLGKPDAYEYPYWENCVGVVKNRVE